MRGRQGGQALTELAISSVVLILILWGAVDLARVYNVDTTLQEAARVGARHGALYDPILNRNPFLCDHRSAVAPITCPAQGNSFLSPYGIQEMVDAVLKGAGLPASQLQSGCPTNPPAFPASAGQPWLYICYHTAAPQVGAPQSSPPSCSTVCGGYDMAVTVVMRFGLFFNTGEFGPSLPVQGSSHFRVQGS